MRIWIGMAMLLAGSGTASATVVQPALGVTATEAVVGGNGQGVFHVLSGSGMPGYSDPNHDPKGFFGITSSAVSASHTSSSFDGRTHTSTIGSAAVDLASGQIHVVAAASRLGSGVNGTSSSAVSASGTVSDTIRITGAIAGSVTIRISMTIDGSITGTSLSGGTQTDLRSAIGAFALAVSGGGGPYAELFLSQLNGTSIQEQDMSSYGGKVVMDGGDATALRFTLYDDVVVTDARRAIPFQATASLNLVAADQPGTITADFGNTARLAVSLPDGLGFTSDSGVFLTQPQDDAPTGVPEPASFSLLAAGLAGLGARCGYTRSGTASTRSSVAASSSSR